MDSSSGRKAHKNGWTNILDSNFGEKLRALPFVGIMKAQCI